jgi:pimeloyl-ACP methyl ester carboxylesterase
MTTTHEFDVRLPDGRNLHAYDTGVRGAADGPVVLWHHGTPNIGPPPLPLFDHADSLGIRWLGYDRPGYGGSTPLPDRDVASAAGDVAAVADAAGVDRFAIMGHSGGSPHALGCAALLPHRVSVVVAGSSLAPFGANGLDWFAGMAPSGEAALRAAVAGRAAKERYEASATDDGSGFTAADHAALGAEWSWFGSVVGPALAHGPGGLIDDDLAYVHPWGFDPTVIDVPVLLFHGAQDRLVPVAHSEWLAAQIGGAELRISPADGHVSVLRSAPAALDWLAAHATD